MIKPVLWIAFLWSSSVLCGSEWTNDVVKRLVYLKSAVVREEVELSLTPTQLDPELKGDSRYLIRIPGFKTVCSYTASLLNPKNGEKQLLEMTEEKVNCGHGETCYWVHGFRMAGTELKVGQQVKLVLNLAHSGSLKPSPAAATQNSPLKLLYDEPVHFYSPYPTKKQKTSFALPKNFKILSKSCPTPNKGLEQPTVNQVNNNLLQWSCGTYSDVPALSIQGNLKVHYQAQGIAFATVTSLERHLTVLPWFNLLLVTEKWKVRHDGFRLAGGKFSRSQFLKAVMEKNQQVQVIGAMPFLIPATSFDVQVRDEVGLITGQKTRNVWQGSLHQFSVPPRYPLNGGWSSTFDLSYKVPLNQFLSTIDGGLKDFTVPLFSLSYDIPIEHFLIRFNLPEDAKITEYVYPLLDPSRVRTLLTKYKTYFSSKGEVSFEIVMSNLVQEHSQYITVNYEYPWWGIFRKPFVILATLLFGLLCFKLGTSINVSIGHKNSIDPIKVRKELVEKFRKRREHLSNLDDFIGQLGSDKKKQSELDNLQGGLSTATEDILESLRTALKVDPSVSFAGATLKKLYEEHRSCVNMIIENHNSTGSSASSLRSRSASTLDVGHLAKDAVELDNTILKWESKLLA